MTFFAPKNAEAMTSIITDVARQYRARAEEARARADEATDDATRKSLLQIAETWERMAQWEERTNPQRHLWKRDQPPA